MGLTIVDTHPHIVADDDVAYPPAPIGGTRSDWSQERPVTFDVLRYQMGRAGVAKAAIVHSSTVYGFDNSYVLDSVADHTDRFVGVYSVDMRAHDVTAQIEQLAASPGIGGLRIFTTGSTLDGQAYSVDDPATYDAWECAQSLGLPVCIQVTAGAIPDVVKLLERFPQVPIILDHMAKPSLADGPPYSDASHVFALADYPRLVIKVTPRVIALASQGAASPDTFFPALVERFGADRLMWGSNYPNNEGTLAELTTSALRELAVLDNDDLAWVMGRTAQRVYPGLAEAQTPTPPETTDSAGARI